MNIIFLFKKKAYKLSMIEPKLYISYYWIVP